MAGIFLAKRSTIHISKASLKHKPCYVCFCTAFERAEWQGREEGTGADEITGISSNDPVRQCMYEAKQKALDVDENTRTGATQFVADTAKEGVRKATEIADTLGGTAKKTMDGAWEASKEANQKIRDAVDHKNNGNSNSDEDPFVVEAQKIDGPVGTVEYRNIKINIKDVRKAD